MAQRQNTSRVGGFRHPTSRLDHFQRRVSPRRRTKSIPRILLAMCAVALLAAGCATTKFDVAMKKYWDAPVCCASFSGFPIEDLRSGDSKSFDLDNHSPAFTFNTGKSYFKAFRLPPFSAPYRLTVRSYLVGNDIRSAYIFFPQVMMLNEAGEVVRVADFCFLELEKAGFFETARETWGIMRKLEGHIDVMAENRQERYAVVYTTEKLLSAKVVTSRWEMFPIIFPGIVGAIPIGKEDVWIPASPTGHINVSLSELPK